VGAQALRSRDNDAMESDSVPCPGCARGYAAERFPYGRVLHCTCGARVERRWASGVPERTAEPCFLADVMLGKLARWLRVLGYDTAWEPMIDDALLVRRGAEEGRWVLTQDRRLVRDRQADHLLLIEKDAPLEQLQEVAAQVPLSRDRLFRRCMECNTPLHDVSPAEADPRVPRDVLSAAGGVRRCPGCERVYWDGSHTRRMRRQLEGVLG
jgi:uncharacterized protein